jgi:hypothetical protein
MGGNEQNVVERQRFLQNTHGLSLTQSGIIRARPRPTQTSDKHSAFGRNLPTQIVGWRLTPVPVAANFASAFNLLGRTVQ